eukprot:CAMPEP_0176332646 /NCGR_PEP_ID=MMETSP0121_2-20121125/77177_1 /TAXON_ID=160619 /ORGANISM="Kryptoperidinium foliaceum, Strain CCMP 1326" /LENGTH=234 /DNA_ID=CAMNT_0017675537 /DNA_START=87 /DNA_END=791 /DNA_ORIENTATION=+
MASTRHWSAGEPALTRNSFNAIVNRKEFDAPADLCNSLSMGKAAMMGPDYVPNSILARVMSGTLPSDGHQTLKGLERRPVAVGAGPLCGAELLEWRAVGAHGRARRQPPPQPLRHTAQPGFIDRLVRARVPDAEDDGSPHNVRDGEVLQGQRVVHLHLEPRGDGHDEAQLQQTRGQRWQEAAAELRRPRVDVPDENHGTSSGERAELDPERNWLATLGRDVEVVLRFADRAQGA